MAVKSCTAVIFSAQPRRAESCSIMTMKRKHRRPKRSGSATKVGLVHYRKEQWGRWLEVVDDRETWQDTYEEWQREAEAAANRLRLAELEVVWVDLDPDLFSQWCKVRGYKNDAEARSRFAAEQIGNIPPPPGGRPVK